MKHFVGIITKELILRVYKDRKSEINLKILHVKAESRPPLVTSQFAPYTLRHHYT